MSDAFWDCIDSDREHFRREKEIRQQEQEIEQQRAKAYSAQLILENQIQTKLHDLMNQNKQILGSPPAYYLLEIYKEQNNSKQEITCKLVPATKYSLDRNNHILSDKNSYENLYGCCITQKMIPKED